MNREHPAGKGDTPRNVDGKTYRQNHDAIFRKTLREVCQLCSDCDCMGGSDFDSHDECNPPPEPIRYTVLHDVDGEWRCWAGFKTLAGAERCAAKVTTRLTKIITENETSPSVGDIGKP
jgi:hypothetical protein